MNCQQVHEKIEGYYEGELPIDEELGIDIHLVQCPKCGRELGGIKTLVLDFRDTFESLPNDSNFDNLQEELKELDQNAAENEKVRARFFKRDLLLQFVLLCVIVPTFWLVGNKVIEAYSASDKMLDSTLKTGSDVGQLSDTGNLPDANSELRW
jgi:hypothetical protein